MNSILGIIIVFLGFLLLWKNEAIFRFTGSNSWAEQHLGAEGGTRLLYKLIGLIAIFIGFLVMVGLIQGFLVWTLSPILRPIGGTV